MSDPTLGGPGGWYDQSLTRNGAKVSETSCAGIAAAIRAAENDALERAALAVDDAFHGDCNGKPIIERIRALKHVST